MFVFFLSFSALTRTNENAVATKRKVDLVFEKLQDLGVLIVSHFDLYRRHPNRVLSISTKSKTDDSPVRGRARLLE